jgi:putative restriction endonuclease
MRKAYVGVTDFDWYEQLAHATDCLEINFWQPGGRHLFKVLSAGDLFLFKLHSPNNYIVGGGFFETASLLPVSLAWETFRVGNGVRLRQPSLHVRSPYDAAGETLDQLTESTSSSDVAT